MAEKAAMKRKIVKKTKKPAAAKKAKVVSVPVSDPPPLLSPLFGYTALIVVGAVMLGVLWRTIAQQPALDSSVPDISTQTTYASPSEGYAFSYPILWRVSEFTTAGQTDEGKPLHSLVVSNGVHRIVIYTESTVSSETLIPSAPTRETVGALSAERYHDYDPATGGPLDRVVIKRPDGRYNEIRGYGPVFERVLQSFHFAESALGE
ncbi:hypothetical protein COV04_04570 [Candidatus Uhrbacteria bacterium CG10_big_fil_rev_8_21_14_0_10_48_11]|uniref:Uncharacterized protein n=1 Tax=Candidatus Uhrbacteria bacterium CG10_big_fil_rev_8_21_14_0_10_48_11 TaxID=1975037 RepID=A0A2M8LDG6_9BACT|nr:MAG: hypothetical protein COV04_04570 [Candidatus Uhrbacteria bacterium CG10_big_fil_rev_8_21_14_0_10_48_11]